jgi:hypothetical protein
MDIVNSLDENVWHNFVNEHPQSNIFHTPETFQVFKRAEGYYPELWAAVNRDGYPLAILLPVKVTLRIGPLDKLTTRSIAYGSVLSANSPEGLEALILLLSVYKTQSDKNSLFTELRNVSDLSSLQGVLEECEFVFEDHLNYLINLERSPEALLQSFNQNTRKRIRRALRQGKVTVTMATERDHVAICYEQFRKSYTNARIPLADKSLFEAAYDFLHSKGMIQFFLAWIDNECIAASAELIYKDCIYGWFGGVDRDYSSFVPNELLMWHILKWGAENGFKIYDFGGAGKQEEKYGVRDFKAKFGGNLVRYGRNMYVRSKARLAFSKLAYEFYRKSLGFR